MFLVLELGRRRRRRRRRRLKTFKTNSRQIQDKKANPIGTQES
jgi:hypothetical protein